ncbi:Thiol-disulfide isomerase or thioredoxin [Paramicrobacterium humi]|uniref:Thiol-disulfide isomerase or thioredoxin n=1 Tax=Paramicrobacterium humi TaxID=640635 RepID=A0A1H4JPJ6_9MICO|nr:TlpA disulfide reductase family protein [Microbacterium humi]SEB47895.1 Thiol-disulfide isomerase or thioredoxin [Microbacterium humi]
MTAASRAGRALTAAALIAVALTVAGCSNDPLAEQYREGSNKGYIAGDGSVMEVAADDRGAPIEFSGTTQDDETLSSESLDGKVVVVNFWYASCAPCRAEAPILEKLYDKYSSEGVAFVGVNLRDQAGTAAAFNKTYGVSYSSIMDADSGAVKLAFSGTVPPNSVPTTIVLDKQGRVASRVLGAVQDTSILGTLIGDTLAEK